MPTEQTLMEIFARDMARKDVEIEVYKEKLSRAKKSLSQFAIWAQAMGVPRVHVLELQEKIDAL